MTNKHILFSWLHKCANKYQTPSLLGLKEVLFEVLETNSNRDTLADEIVNAILATHLIQLTTDQEERFRFFWTKAVSELT